VCVCVCLCVFLVGGCESELVEVCGVASVVFVKVGRSIKRKE
jgi:hypothetical protein